MRRSRTTVAVLVAALALTGCGGEREDAATGEGGRLSIATGNTTGVYYQLGGGLGRLIGKNVPATRRPPRRPAPRWRTSSGWWRATATSPSPSPTPPPTPSTGKGAFDGPQPIRALARIYTNYTQVLVRTDAGITTIADMKGKTVSTGSPNSGTEVIAVRLLTAAGLDPEADDQAAEAVAAGDRAGHEGRRHRGDVLVRRACPPPASPTWSAARRQGALPRPVRRPARAAGRVRPGLPAGDASRPTSTSSPRRWPPSACPTCSWSRTR